jgi:hypothetical protein
MSRLISVFLLAGALIVVAPARASADPFVVTTGVLAFDFEGDFFGLGGDGFRFAGSLFFESFDRVQAPSCNPCAGGQILNPSFQSTGEVDMGPGGAQIGDLLFDDVSWRGSFDIRSVPLVFPETDADFVPVRTPFQFTAFLRAFVGADEVFSGDVVGDGTAFLIYVPRLDGLYEWEEGVARFFFDEITQPAPVPEPSTLIMAGLGAAALVRRRLRRVRTTA